MGHTKLGPRDNSFGKGAALGITHHALARGQNAPGEFASDDERWRGSTGVGALAHHDVGEIDAARLDIYQDLIVFGLGTGDVLQLEDFGASDSSGNDGFHIAISNQLSAFSLFGSA